MGAVHRRRMGEGKVLMNISGLAKAFHALSLALVLLWAPAVAAEESDVERGRRQIMESLYDVVYRGNPDERMVRWKMLPKVMVVNASPDERALVQDKVRQFSEVFGSPISLTEFAQDAGIIVFFVSSHNEIEKKYADVVKYFMGVNAFNKHSPNLFSSLLNNGTAVAIEPYASNEFEITASVISIKSGSESKDLYAARGLAISFGLRGETQNNSIKNVNYIADIKEIDRVMLRFMYFHGRPGMGWPEAKGRMERLLDQIFGGGR